MHDLADMIWIELRKAIRSKMPLWTALGSLVMPMGIAFLIFVARNPAISKKLGLISAKANLLVYSTTDWPSYLGLSGAVLAAVGFFLFVLTISWVFGREFADGTLKDMLAVPVQRALILWRNSAWWPLGRSSRPSSFSSSSWSRAASFTSQEARSRLFSAAVPCWSSLAV